MPKAVLQFEVIKRGKRRELTVKEERLIKSVDGENDPLGPKTLPFSAIHQ